MDKYVKIRRIGEGAFGKAELVKRKADNSQMVVKEINILRMGAKEREEARKEVSVLAQLKHPNIVAYRESFEEHGSLYIVMDFCAGGDLYAKINSQRGILFGEDMILDWFVQMCLAIKHIHDRKILHRDIKSQNIFLTSRGMVQLGDFGIAKVLNSTVELARTCIGTPYYLSPEICENKPYNNKSDVWSLGCVLYELATLKHAFEAGNMKNLVLKIIRGSYPPLSPKYSYEMRNLVSQLFKRAPRDRPSINSILKKPFISQRIPKFLSTDELESEFSHTVMHGHKLGRPLPPPPKAAGRPPSASRNRPDGAGAAAAAAAKKYDPSKIYGQPVVRKSKENRAPGQVRRPGSASGSRPGSAASSRPGSAAGSRPGSAAGSRPGSAAGNRPSSSQANKKSNSSERPVISQSYKDLQRRKQEMLEREKKRREEARKKELEKRHKDLQERQKMARMNKAREEGWNNILGSLDSDSGKDQKAKGDVRDQARMPPPPAPQPQPRPVAGPGGDYNGNAAAPRGKYDHYNDYLDKLQKERDVRMKQDAVPPRAPAANYMASPRQPGGAAGAQQVPVWRRAPSPTPYQQYNQRGQNQQEERKKLVEDFISRRQEAAHNKQRGHAQLFGPSNNNDRRPPSGARATPEPQNPPPSAPSAAAARNRDEQEYLERLRQIRQQNYNERKNMQARQAPDDTEERKRKAEALKKQAEDWAKQRQAVVDKKKQEFIEYERQMREQKQAGNRPGAPPPVMPRPGPAVPMTGAVNAIGATPRVIAQTPSQPSSSPGMTNVLGAIGVQAKVVSEEDRPKTPVQQKKESILKKLNSKGPPKGVDEPKDSGRSKWGAGGGAGIQLAEDEPQDSARSKWGAGGGPGLKLAEEAPESARSQWGAPPAMDLANLDLEHTASQMEATSARDRVIVNPESARRQWGTPGDTIVKKLGAVPLAEQTMASDKSEGSVESGMSTGEGVISPAPAAAGATIVISSKPAPIQQGTITIRTAEQNKNAAGTDLSIPSPPSPRETTPGRLSPVPETARSQIESPVEGRSPTRSPSQTSPVTSPEPSNKADDKPAIQSESASQTKPPLPARKPPLANKPTIAEKPDLAEKPIVLPKPVLLPKPDAPMQFAPSGPVSVKSQGAGQLFEKVDSDTTTSGQARADQSEQPEDKVTVTEFSEDGEKRKTGLLMGLTMGSFDIGHRELLRTCSEPDLASLFRTMNHEPPLKVKVKSLDDMSVVGEEDEESLADVYRSMEKAVESADRSEDMPEDGANTADDNRAPDDNDDQADDSDEQPDNNDDQPDDDAGDDGDMEDEDEDLADLMSVRATMQSLLVDDSEDDSKKSPVKFSLSSDVESRGHEGDVDDTEDDQLDGGSDAGSGDEAQDQNEAGDQDASSEGEEAENGDNPDGVDNEEIRRSYSVDNENPETPDESRDDGMSELFQTDDDSDTDFNDGDEGDFDLFGRLEESRAQLEEELGAEKLIQVYKTVQALQEDEDENMEEGARIAQQLLGEDKVHLYPKVFQLVMADAAFTDDNLS